MKLKIRLVVVALAMLFGATFAQAAGIVVNIDPLDRPYYTRGPSYWVGRSHYVWVPGHWSRGHGHWVRGHYKLI